MVHAADSESWQRIFGHAETENSRGIAPDDEVGGLHRAVSYDSIVDFLVHSTVVALSARPVGRRGVRLAKRRATRGAPRRGPGRRANEAAERTSDSDSSLASRGLAAPHSTRPSSDTRRQLMSCAGRRGPFDYSITATIRPPGAFSRRCCGSLSFGRHLGDTRPAGGELASSST